jgi:hypothetical protein
VRVQNASAIPFEIDRVSFDCKFEPPADFCTPSGVGAKEIGKGYRFVPRDEATKGPLRPGEYREYFLPQKTYDDVVLLGTSLSPEQYWIAAYSDGEEVGKVTGKLIRPYLAEPGIAIHRRAQPVFDTMPESDRLALVMAVAPLRVIDPERWPPRLVQRLKNIPTVFSVRVGPDLRVLVTRTEHNGVEVVDIVRKSALEQFNPTASSGGDQA